MRLHMLKSKLHRAVVTEADLSYEGSITIDQALCEAAHFLPHEQVHIYNCNAGTRFSTYVIYGQPGEVCLNGAAARLVQPGDRIIIACYADMDEDEARAHEPIVLLLDDHNQVS